MFYQKGTYKLVNGMTAIVAQIRCYGSDKWILKGAIVDENIYFCMTWNIKGQTNNPAYNLLERIA